MLIPGYATAEGTARFRDRFEPRLPGHVRPAGGLWVSSIGLGTYLGEPTQSHDALYREAIIRAAELGTNVFDSAINYRHQRSERSIGQALAELLASGTVQRDEVLLATKGGFLSFDADQPADPQSYFYEKLIEPELVRSEEVVAGCHVMAPKFLANQVEASRRNLGVETIDIYYLHNPETQISEVSREEFTRRLRAAFEALEHAVAEGKIRVYGTATWNAYRVKPGAPDSISLEQVLRVAEEAGGQEHHFRAIQLPFNLAMPEALAAPTQLRGGKPVSVLELARANEMMVFASASLMQSHLCQGLPADIQRSFPGLATDAQRALQFVRSTPGITCALVGMSRLAHVEENLAAAAISPLTIEQFRAIFAK